MDSRQISSFNHGHSLIPLFTEKEIVKHSLGSIPQFLSNPAYQIGRAASHFIVRAMLVGLYQVGASAINDTRAQRNPTSLLAIYNQLPEIAVTHSISDEDCDFARILFIIMTGLAHLTHDQIADLIEQLPDPRLMTINRQAIVTFPNNTRLAEHNVGAIFKYYVDDLMQRDDRPKILVNSSKSLSFNIPLIKGVVSVFHAAINKDNFVKIRSSSKLLRSSAEQNLTSYQTAVAGGIEEIDDQMISSDESSLRSSGYLSLKMMCCCSASVLLPGIIAGIASWAGGMKAGAAIVIGSSTSILSAGISYLLWKKCRSLSSNHSGQNNTPAVANASGYPVLRNS